MAANTQFSIAVHLMAGLAHRGDCPTTSAMLAASVNTSASFVRRTLARLSAAGLVHTATGRSGACRLAREPGKVSLLDIYQAVGAPRTFTIHSYPVEKHCTVSCNIKSCLEGVLDKTQKSVETTLKKITLADVLCDLKAA